MDKYIEPEDRNCEMCQFCYRDMEPKKDGKFDFHCRYFEKIGLDPLNTNFAKQCKLFSPVGYEPGEYDRQGKPIGEAQD
jgi:hypothetical protein